MSQDGIFECVQGDPQWLAIRCGMVTSSRAANAISFLSRKSKNGEKGEETAARANLKIELACEILTKKASEHYVSRWMEEGKDKEPLARAAYERLKDVECEQVGFIFHPKIKMAGCSPDALIGNDGVAEFKCPRKHTHLKYMIAGVIPEEYLPQCHWLLACSEREWLDFGSHEPDFRRKDLKTFIAPRLYRDDKIIADMEEKVMRFNDEVQELILKLDPDYLVNQLAASIAHVNGKKTDAGLLITEADIA